MNYFLYKIFKEIQGKRYLSLHEHDTTNSAIIDDDEPVQDINPTENKISNIPDTPAPQVQKQIFVAHGKNHKPLEQFKIILEQFKIPYKIAIEESNQGRPISQKVSELMRECSSAVFLFTKDEEIKDGEGEISYRPSDNVVFELGTASILYGDKIVIFKQKDVKFGSDFKDLGYISFEDDLGAKSMDLMKELVDLDLLKISPT